MLLLLYKNLKLNTRLSRQAVKDHLLSLTSNGNITFSQNSVALNGKFSGEVDNDYFKIAYYSCSYPIMVCTGSVKKSDTGTEIDMVIRPDGFICLASLFFYLEVVGWLIYLVFRLICRQPITLADEFPWQMIIFTALSI